MFRLDILEEVYWHVTIFKLDFSRKRNIHCILNGDANDKSRGIQLLDLDVYNEISF